MSWDISGEELAGTDLTALTLTDTGTGWSITRVPSADQVARLTVQVQNAEALAARTGETVTLDLSVLFRTEHDQTDP